MLETISMDRSVWWNKVYHNSPSTAGQHVYACAPDEKGELVLIQLQNPDSNIQFAKQFS